jgi:hypothetical protein
MVTSDGPPGFQISGNLLTARIFIGQWENSQPVEDSALRNFSLLISAQ